MNGKILLDTSIAVWWLRGGDRFRAFAQRFADDRALLPLIVVGEMLYGARRHHAPEEEQKRVLAFTEQFALIGISFVTADRYATLRADLSRGGRADPGERHLDRRPRAGAQRIAGDARPALSTRTGPAAGDVVIPAPSTSSITL